MKDKCKFAFLPKLVSVIGMKEDTSTLIWLKKYYISEESEYESLNGETVEVGMEYVYPSQAEFTFLSLIKLSIFFCSFSFLYILLKEFL